MTKESSFNAKKFLSELNSKWTQSKRCPICSNNNWTISPDPNQLMRFSGGNLIVGGAIIPVVVVTCTNCGYTLLFNPLVLGALETPEK